MRIRFLVPLATAALTLALPAAAQLKVVTTIPDLADLVSVIGGERIEKVTSLARGTMNVHAVPLRPSKLIAASQADVFFQIGLSLEHAYVPELLGQAHNSLIEPGSPGFITCAEGWNPVEVPDVIDRDLSGDRHPEGNPHFNLDPEGGKHLADRILEGLIANDQAGEEGYRACHGAFLVELAEHEKRWAELRKKLRGKRVVMYHGDFNYLLESCGMESIGTLEPGPGLPPTPDHMADLVRRMKDQGVKVILTAKWSNEAAVRSVARETGARVVELPVMVGGVKGADSWLEMMDVLHDSLVEACVEG